MSLFVVFETKFCIFALGGIQVSYYVLNIYYFKNIPTLQSSNIVSFSSQSVFSCNEGYESLGFIKMKSVLLFCVFNLIYFHLNAKMQF